MFFDVIFGGFFVNIIIFARWIFAGFTPFLQKAKQIVVWGFYPILNKFVIVLWVLHTIYIPFCGAKVGL